MASRYAVLKRRFFVMNFRLTVAVFCTVVIGAYSCCGGDGGGLVLSEASKARYAVVVPDNYEASGFSFAVSDMTNLLFKATGAAFPVVRRSASPKARRLFVGVAPEGEKPAQMYGP